MMKLILPLIFSLVAFSEPYNPSYLLEINKSKLQPGDIIVLKPSDDSFTTQFGHMAIVGKNDRIIDFKSYFYGFFDSPIDVFINSIYDRKFLVLRYKEMDKLILDNIESMLKDFMDKEYDVFMDFDGSYYATYCSQFVYELYKKAYYKAYKKNVEFAKKDKLIILPEDFLGLDIYEYVNF